MNGIFSYIDKLTIGSPDVPAKAHEAKATAQVKFQQRKEQAGLLCTSELEVAVARCRRKVDAIIKDCRARNCRFRDIEFDLEGDRERCLYGLNVPGTGSDDGSEYIPAPSGPADVLRVTQIFDDPEFFIDGANSSDVVQGALGNCWFMSAVSTVATMEGLIERICVHRDQQVGVYGFVFYRDSGWVDIIIDDLLYTRIPKFEELYGLQDLYHGDKDKFDAAARIGGKTLYFSKSKTENETWLPLLEKAYAKLNGDYAALSGGLDSEAIEAMTGGISNMIHVKDILDIDQFWDEQLLNVQKDRLFGCSIDDSRGMVNGKLSSIKRVQEILTSGLRPFHWTRLLGPGSSGDQRKAIYGSKEWTGDWLVRLPEMHHKFGDDGEFLMEYKDFLKTWTTIERSRLFDRGWKLSSMWLDVSSRSYPCAWSFGDVSFTFSVTGDTPAAIVLSQLNDRFFTDISGYNQWSIDFVVYRKGAPFDEPYTRSYHNHFWTRVVSVELNNLEAGEYILHVRLDRRYQRKKTYYQDALERWDVRKLSKVWTQAAISKSIALNFNPDEYLPAPEELFGGEDLNSLEEKQIGLEIPQPTTVSDSNPALSLTEAQRSEVSKAENAAVNGKEKDGKVGEEKVVEKRGKPDVQERDQPGAATHPDINGTTTKDVTESETVKKEGVDGKKDDSELVVVTTEELDQATKVLHEGFTCKECKASAQYSQANQSLI
ncbi:unnamed protein product [Rhizoctonia solani]|uniref:Calpain catalytic domain-containing protein n=1 Tax=Rhizoctonia solani TaxID=456999 RepID=A0A8H2WH96_9AGAM|nr:unnamed protein product [Rhizoctonia solani]